ncbi:hypothetical protein BBF96_09770 [Anoxybacter fermentans]|uniref:HTH arsR-type domain-containing protein n=1 Tax=Anoxybacter fermentans TaxID=1323375 RepID=A0A3S9SZA5_9FIRM|nr:transcriptional regulator [Anoxybacter fermentans]AZR73647.1 hypothetical protein BBF96_09770 [Anoxybacter fermentans]
MDQLKSFLNTRRIEILEILSQREATVKQLADLFGKSPANIHHHVKNLENSGLITIVRTEEKSGIIEKYYRAIAEKFVVDESIGQPDKSNASEKELCEIILNSSKEDLQEGIEFISELQDDEIHKRVIKTGIQKGQISNQKLSEFLGELYSLINRYFKPVTKTIKEDEIYTFNFQIYPAPPPVESNSKSINPKGGMGNDKEK